MNEEKRRKLIDKLEQQRNQAWEIRKQAVIDGNTRQVDYAKGLLSACRDVLITMSQPPPHQTGYLEILEMAVKILDDSRQKG